MTRLTGGEAVVHSLLANGVDTVFGLPGVQNDYLYNALFDAGDRVRVLHTRHEQGAAYMALGYALATGRPGVYNVVPGPGLLNTTAALATAYGANAKVLCLTGQIRADQIGRGFGMLHEIPDQLGIVRSLTKWAARVESPAQTPGLVAEAFRQLNTDRPRPVGLEVPMDVLADAGEVDLSQAVTAAANPPVDADAIDAAARMLGAAQNPLIFVGSGAQEAGAAVQELAELLQAPVFASGGGRGVLDSRHDLSHSQAVGHRLWAAADVVLAVGSRMQRPLQGWGMDKQLKLIRIDLDPAEHWRVAPVDVRILADARDALAALIPAVARHNRARPSRRDEMAALKAQVAADWGSLQPQMSFIHALRDALPEDGILVDDLTQVGYVARYAFPVYGPRTYISSGYQGTLGWSYAAALGAKVARPDRPVLAIAGDGGFMFNVQELATAVQHKIATVMVIFNDGAYGNVRRMQVHEYDERVIATDLQNPDFVKLAEAFGALGLRARSPDELRSAIGRGFASGLPTLIDVPVGEMPSPWRLFFLPKVRG